MIRSYTAWITASVLALLMGCAAEPATSPGDDAELAAAAENVTSSPQVSLGTAGGAEWWTLDEDFQTFTAGDRWKVTQLTACFFNGRAPTVARLRNAAGGVLATTTNVQPTAEPCGYPISGAYFYKIVFDSATAPILSPGQYAISMSRDGEVFGIVAAYDEYSGGGLVHARTSTVATRLDLLGSIGYAVEPVVQPGACGDFGTHKCCCPPGTAPYRFDFFVGGRYHTCPPDPDHAPGCECRPSPTSPASTGVEGMCTPR